MPAAALEGHVIIDYGLKLGHVGVKLIFNVGEVHIEIN